MVHLHDGILHSGRKEGILAFFNNIDGTVDYYADKPISERQIPYGLTYKWNLMNKIN